MYLLFSSTESRTDKGALDMRCDADLANYFCSLSVISKLNLHTFFFSFNLPNFRSFLNGGLLRSWLEQCWSGRTEVCSLYWLVRLPVKAGNHAYALEQINIASTSQALRLANRNVSIRDCDLISINRSALLCVVFFYVWVYLEQHAILFRNCSVFSDGVVYLKW